MMTKKLFLSARWEHLVMINYEVDPSVLISYVPKGTEVDLWNGKAYISLVGFMFLDTRVLGLSIPFHKNFEEVNLRFYIKREERRGVAFIKEIVPKWGIAAVARLLYNENYEALPMRSSIQQLSKGIHVQYQWKSFEKWQSIQVLGEGIPQSIQAGSQAEFITEHYFGYSIQRNKETMEYEVEHPPWEIWEASQYEINVDMKRCYGLPFASFLEKTPASVFLAKGSIVQVFKGHLIGSNR